jgi:hypothetical protein
LASDPCSGSMRTELLRLVGWHDIKKSETTTGIKAGSAKFPLLYLSLGLTMNYRIQHNKAEMKQTHPRLKFSRKPGKIRAPMNIKSNKPNNFLATLLWKHAFTLGFFSREFASTTNSFSFFARTLF